MKIIIGPTTKGTYGGVTQHIRNIVKYSKYKIDILYTHDYSLKSFDGVFKKISPVAQKFDWIDPIGLFMSGFILPNKYNIIHLHGHPWWPEIYKKYKIGRARYIHSVHQVYLKEDHDYKKGIWKYYNKLNKFMIKSCKNSDVVIAVAKWLQKLLKDDYAIDSIYIPNGADASDFINAEPKRFRDKFGINKDFYLFAARISKYKRTELFVEIAKRMRERAFVMCGKDVTKENLEKYIKEEVPKNIICIGELTREEVINAISACRVFISPSKHDTFPTAIMEAMACKKPVVASNSAGPKEIISSNIDGFLFEADDIDDLYEKSSTAWERPEIGLKAYEKIKENFDWKIIIKKIDNLYEDLVNK